MYQIAKIAVENAAMHFDKEFSYYIPPELCDTVAAGCRVCVPFGKGNKRRTGIVLSVEEMADRERLKPVLSAIDFTPLLGSEGLYLLRYLKQCSFCTWFDALRVLIPAGVGISYQIVYALGLLSPTAVLTPLGADIIALVSQSRKGIEQDKLCEILGITSTNAQLLELVESGQVLCQQLQKQRIGDDKVCMVRLVETQKEIKTTPKQSKVIKLLTENESASLKEICYYCAVTKAVVDKLVQKGAVEYFEQIALRNPYEDAQATSYATTLSSEQQAAYLKLLELIKQDKPKPALLYGVTGSGKTQVFLHLIKQVVDKGRQVIVMVPEIALTAQTLASFHALFGEQVAVLHSGLSLGQRMDEWRRIKNGGAKIALGTRSAVFAPFDNIGLIVLDEEQEHTYKSDQAPRFHARDVANIRCINHGALLLLASATPSLESFYKASEGQYSKLILESRYNNAVLPNVFVVDMRDGENLSENPSISKILLEHLQINLQNKEQSILLLNRRGYSTVVKCSSCSEPAGCPNCSVSLTFHTANDSLICHYCGYIQSKSQECSHCGSQFMRYSGIGTQKLEEDIAILLPDARVLRVDMDTTMNKFSHERLFSSFAAGEYDIMIGTQMVAKGLNFPNVTLVGVVCADHSLYSDDFRSLEKSFSLLTQVVGRCGRGQKKGRAFIQTFSPDNPIFEMAATQDYKDFYSQEIFSRKIHLYPPFCTMAGIGFVGLEQAQVELWANKFLQKLKEIAGEKYKALPIRVLGPVPSDIAKAAGKYRYKIILKCKNNAKTRELLWKLTDWFYTECKTVTVFVDMYYDRI